MIMFKFVQPRELVSDKQHCFKTQSSASLAAFTATNVKL